jgi:Fe-S-cluster containining protein
VELTDKAKSDLCIKCQYCCTAVYIPLAKGTNLELYIARGFQILFRGADPFIILEDMPCQHLTNKGCNIYNIRPLVCSLYDGRKDLFFPEKCLWSKQ